MGSPGVWTLPRQCRSRQRHWGWRMGMCGPDTPRCSGKAKNEAPGQLTGEWLKQVCPDLALQIDRETG